MVHIFQSNRPRQLLLDKTLSPSRSRGHAIIIMTIIITHTRLYGLKPVGWDTKTNNVNELKKTRDVFTPFTRQKCTTHQNEECVEIARARHGTSLDVCVPVNSFESQPNR
jgi:hypothetical protein